jgi:hypothetical protein
MLQGVDVPERISKQSMAVRHELREASQAWEDRNY